MIQRLSTLILCLLLWLPVAQAQKLDRSQPPKPAAPRAIQLGEYESFTLENGLRVYVVSNPKTPRVTMQITLDRDPIKEGPAAGYVSITGQMLKRGTTTRTKAELDQEIDFIGATLMTYSTGVYASALKRHNEKLFELAADVLLNPTFPTEELEKLRKESIDGLEAGEQNPDAIMADLSRVMTYGKDHPYGEVETKASLESITTGHCRGYYQTYFRPNIAYLAIVGDITLKEAKALVNKHFGKWEKADVPAHTYEKPQAVATPEVALMDKAGAVQSIITIAYPVELKVNSPDYIAASMANGILGNNGFSARLFQNLREDKGYTYGAYSSLSPDDEIGAFRASAKVRTEVTDSAVAEFMYEIERMHKEPISDAELALAKSVFSGRFARSLEDPQTMARFAINTVRYDLPKDYYATYLQKVDALTIADIQKAAQKYIDPNKARIITVGDGKKIREELTRFGQVKEYDRYGNPVEAVDEEALLKEMTVEQVIEKYLTAVGGADKLKAVKTLRRTASASMQGMTLGMEMVAERPNKLRNITTLPMGMGKQEQIFDGKQAQAVSPRGAQLLEGDMLKEMSIDAITFLELDYASNGLTAELQGVEKVDGKNAFKVVYQSSEGQSRTRLYDTETFLLLKIVAPNQTITLDDYREVEGILFPFGSKITNPQMPAPLPLKIEKVEVNPELEKGFFKVK
ncbi:MAG: M16 family metallopeptidase [Bernardetiaceae bacterium]